MEMPLSPAYPVRRPVLATYLLREPVLVFSLAALDAHPVLCELRESMPVRLAFADGLGILGTAGVGVWFVPVPDANAW